MFPDLDEIIKQMFRDDLKQQAADTDAKKTKQHKDGMMCTKCNLLNEYVTEPNQDDGTYVCYKCRKF